MGPSVIPEDIQVSLQHLKTYIYSERCSKDKVLAAFKAQEAEKERLRIEQVQREAAIREGCAAQAAECKPFVDKALSVMSELTSQVFVTTKVRN